MGAASRSSRTATAELARGALQLGVSLSPGQLAAFETYVNTLVFWRSRLSLTAAATPLAIVRSHILDSLPVARFIEPGWRVADLGSGAGFPGIPLAIVCPQSRIVLIESRRKKANFLRDVARRCQLANAEVSEERAEVLAAESPEIFDLVVSRAVWPVSDFLGISRALLRSEGLAIAMKGPKARAETTSDPAFASPQVVFYKLHGGIERLLLVYRKRSPDICFT